MLLSSLSILIGAILVPNTHLWLYSTYIVFVCLYLIYLRRMKLSFVVGLSICSVLISEYRPISTYGFEVGESIWVDFAEKNIYLQRSNSLDLNRFTTKPTVQITYFHHDGTRFTDSGFTAHIDQSISSADDFYLRVGREPSKLVRATINRITFAIKDGAWWERNLYINRQIAELRLTLLDEPDGALSVSQNSVRERFLSKLDAKLFSFTSWRFSKALLFGENNLWSQRDTWMIRTLGLAHLFVVSGLHTGFMFVIGRFFSQALWKCLPERILMSGLTRWHCDALIVIPLLFSYAYITNWGEPVVRASIMLSVYLCARMLALKFSAYQVITLALWLVLLIDPRTVLSPGLWLSFSMVYLLIGLCQASIGLFRLFTVQVMLSTASMVLVLGWQEAISSISIIVNVVLIPFAGALWFPLGLLSSLEVLLIGTSYGYLALDKVLLYVMLALEWVAFQWPLLTFDLFPSQIPRWSMLVLVVFWVYQSPLKRGVVMAVSIWCVLFYSSMFSVPFKSLTLTNVESTFVLRDNSQLLKNSRWMQDDFFRVPVALFLGATSPSTLYEEVYLLSAQMERSPDPFALLEKGVGWVILSRPDRTRTLDTLNALGVHWLAVSPGESLEFYLYNNYVSVRHSSCLYSFFLMKSDTCKRVEKLESMLNYQQI